MFTALMSDPGCDSMFLQKSNENDDWPLVIEVMNSI